MIRRRNPNVIRSIQSLMLMAALLLPAVLPAAGSGIYVSPDKLAYRPLDFRPPKAERIVLPNGMILYFLEDHELPLVRISATIRTGYMHDPQEKSGLCELTAMTMRMGGVEGMTGDAIDETLEFMSAAIEPNASMEYTNWSFSVLKKDMNKALDIFSRMLRKPAFAEEKFALMKNLKIEDLRHVKDDPERLAFREFNRILYSGNPRGNLPSIATIRAIERADLLDFHRRFYTAANTMIAVSGAITRAEALERLNAYFGTWNGAGVAPPVPAPSGNAPAGFYYLVKDMPQSIIATGHFAPSKNSPDYYPFEMLNFMIGSGGFSSRIFQEIRTNRGLAYSTGSYYRTRMNYGVFGAHATTKTESTYTVLTLLKAILQEIKTIPLGTAELERAKKSMVNSFIFEFQTSQQIAVQQMMIEYNKLPADFLSTFCTRIEELTPQRIRITADHYLQPDNMTVLIVGTNDGYEALRKHYPTMKKIKATDD